MKLDAARFGLAMGAVYALVFFVLTLVSALTGWGNEWMRLIGGIYAGMGPSLGGAVIGALWGFGIGLVFFGLGAWIYNRLLGSR
ncbi:MAG: hypothetical protein HYZ11_08730 [Candidatus Tectomicrobia bacterium]|uniref:Uncharacterized protein n=1 Tax=Tectimicrobiota bacterium TaxID=2528274 RepID=A0A932HYL2_UNCTE|nr:hypothetical protein [Candidatus Tectomicrobia bacterium]